MKKFKAIRLDPNKKLNKYFAEKLKKNLSVYKGEKGSVTVSIRETSSSDTDIKNGKIQGCREHTKSKK